MIKVDLKYKTNLYKDFTPFFLYEEKYINQARCGEHRAFVAMLEKTEDNISSYGTIMSLDPALIEDTNHYLERIVKTLLWAYGGHTLYLYSSKDFFEFIKKTYSKDGKRAFDKSFIVEDIFDKEFKIVFCEDKKDLPKAQNKHLRIGGNTEGHRIGFDLGGSDKKITATIDGKVLFAESIVWNPITVTDINYHKKEILDILNIAKEKLGGKVDAIGGSAPGIIFDNQIKVSSIVRSIADKNQSRNLFLDVINENFKGVPFQVANDGDVSALAGANILNTNRILGIAMGTSQACGYANEEGGINDWFNELAFVPVDLSPNAPQDEWSGDIGCGANFFSQQAVVRLALEAGLDLSGEDTFAKKLKKAQNLLNEGNAKAKEIFETIGYNFGYSVPMYAKLYSISTIMLLGRVMAGKSGEIIQECANRVLENEFPSLGVKIVCPNEDDALHGQAVAAASLPPLK